MEPTSTDKMLSLSSTTPGISTVLQQVASHETAGGSDESVESVQHESMSGALPSNFNTTNGEHVGEAQSINGINPLEGDPEIELQNVDDDDDLLPGPDTKGNFKSNMENMNLGGQLMLDDIVDELDNPQHYETAGYHD